MQKNLLLQQCANPYVTISKLYAKKNRRRQKYITNILVINTIYLSKIKTGITNISLSHLEQIARFYKIIVAELMSMTSGRTETALNLHLSILQMTLANRDREIINLRNKLIELYKQFQS